VLYDGLERLGRRGVMRQVRERTALAS
jgi:hypothetical protein